MELQDERLGRSHYYSDKTGVVHSEVLLPEGAPERLSDRTTLWNEVDAGEKRKDAQLAGEVEFSIPREMSQADGVVLTRNFVRREFVDRGMVADLNVHWNFASYGSPKPHAHVMLAMREVGPKGFGKKVREWNATSELTGWRERWGAHVNQRRSARSSPLRSITAACCCRRSRARCRRAGTYPRSWPRASSVRSAGRRDSK